MAMANKSDGPALAGRKSLRKHGGRRGVRTPDLPGVNPKRGVDPAGSHQTVLAQFPPRKSTASQVGPTPWKRAFRDGAPSAKCPVCARHAYKSFDKGDYEIAQCGTCDFLFVHPYPSGEALAAYYNDDYRQASADHYPKAWSRRQRALQRALLLSPYLIGKSVLELGCGGGFMTWAMSFFAREAVGMDVSEGAIDYAEAHFPRSVFIRCKLSDLANARRSYDLIFSSELIEHLAGVEEFIEAITATTHLGSLVYISAPDTSHRKTPKDLSTWEDVCPPEHLQWFGRQNLEVLMARCGFVPYRRFHAPKPAHNALFRRVA